MADKPGSYLERIGMQSRAEIWNRKREGVKEVMRMLGMGHTRAAIVESLQETYKIGHSTAYEWFDRAMVEMLPSTRDEFNAIRGDVAASLSYAQSVAVGMLNEIKKIPEDGQPGAVPLYTRNKMKSMAIKALMSVVDRRAKLFGLNEERSDGDIVINNAVAANRPDVSMTSGARRKAIDAMIADALSGESDEDEAEDESE